MGRPVAVGLQIPGKNLGFALTLIFTYNPLLSNF